ncbi:MAG: GNAT family N-acetyltransferase [Schleiferilactobacillus perolens]|uniref:GNAT family N-acetyltransferase n=1 Tax=Schleiferilactobacillus perolens TaxID=100468 RepID=UPI0039E8F1F0
MLRTELLDPVQDEDEFYELTLYAFNRKNTPQRQRFFSQLYQNSHAYGVRNDNLLESGFLSIPFTTQIDDDRFKASGISYVSSYPEVSGHGNIGKMMEKAFSDYWESGVVLSYLAPFSFPFYRRFGYEEVFDRVHYRLKNIDVPRMKPIDEDKIRIERHSFNDALPLLSNFYDQHPNSRKGGIERSNWWNNYLAVKHDHWEVALCYRGDLLDGYMVYQREQNVAFRIQELFYHSHSTLQSLLAFAAKHASAYQMFDYVSGDPEPRPDIFPDPHIKRSLSIQIEAYMMARIVNLQRFFDQYHVSKNTRDDFVLNVHDDFIPANEGVWQISIANGTIQATKSDENTINAIEITVQDLTKIMFGYRSASQITTSDFDTVAAAHLNHLCKPNLVPMLWDYF